MSTLLSFDLKKDSLKTLIVPSDRTDLIYLIDTGADTPVWCHGKNELVDIFPDAEKVDAKFLLSGFGKEPELVDVYRIPEFVLSDGTSSIAFQNLIVSVTDRPSIGVDFILPASVFNHMKVTIDRLTSVVNPTLKIETAQNTVPVFFRKIELSDEQKIGLGIEADSIVQNVYARDLPESIPFIGKSHITS